MSPGSAPVLLLFGSGQNTGLAAAKKFAGEGYSVAAVCRTPYDELKKVAKLIIPADLKDPSQVAGVFDKVTKELGSPEVVIYNAYEAHFIDPEDPLQVPSARLVETLAVNVASAYEAARLAVGSFATLPETASKTFLFTGNNYNAALKPHVIALGIGKNASAYWIETAAKTPAYQEKGYKFYYVDERAASGESVDMEIDGEAHAVEFWRLSGEVRRQSHWDWTFVKGHPGGYVDFGEIAERKYSSLSFPFPLPEGGLTYGQFREALASGGKP